MALGLASRIVRLEQHRDPAHRFVDIAVQFHVAELRADGRVYWTDQASRVYGGRWDTKRLEYVGAAENVLHMPCSPPQFEHVLSDARDTEISGGRGLGKSWSGILVCSKNVCDRPFIDGRVVSPTQDLFLVQWDKFVPLMLETGWLLDGENGVKEARHELWFRNGVVVQFRSGHKPGRLASWGGGWAILDEDQDITDKARSKLLYCLREGRGKWQMFHQLTPARGEALAAHDARVAAAAERPDDAKVIHAQSTENIFVDHDVYDFSGRRQGREQHAIEVLGDWETVRQQEATDAPRPVFGCLVEEWERYQNGDHGLAHEWPVVWSGRPGDRVVWKGLEDITAEVARGVFGLNHKFTWSHLGGVDPGTRVPNSFTIWKLFRRRRDRQRPDPKLDIRTIWVCWDYFEALGHCGQLGREIVAAGYRANDIAVVPDFSAWTRSYLRRPDGSGVAKKGLGPAAARMLQQEGFYVAGAARVNPRVPASVQDVLEKLDPAVGAPRLLFRLPATEPVFSNMASVIWDKNGKDFDPSVPNDPTDSARYPISFVDPAARVTTSGVHAYVSKAS